MLLQTSAQPDETKKAFEAFFEKSMPKRGGNVYFRKGRFEGIRGFISLVRATRIQRTLTTLSTLMVPIAFANKISYDILKLIAICILLYCSSSIINAKKDNDYKLPRYYFIAVIILMLLALAISVSSSYLFLAFISWLALGQIYNTIARRVLFGDATLLAITHHVMPVVFASLILGLDKKTTVALSLFMFVIFWLIINMKNLKDTEEDLLRGYKTLSMTKKGFAVTKILFEFSVVVMFLAYFIFGLSEIYLYGILSVLLMKITVSSLIELNKYETALNFTRLLAIIFLAALVIDKTTKLSILALSLLLGIAYTVFMLSDFISLFSKTRNTG